MQTHQSYPSSTDQAIKDIPTSAFRFHHLGIAVRDMEKARATYKEIFGHQLLAGPIDEPSLQATLCTFGTGQPGDMLVELIAPLGKDSHVHNWLKQDKGTYHVCYEVDDIEQCIADLKAKHWIHESGPTESATFGGRRIAWLYSPARQLIELVEGE